MKFPALYDGADTASGKAQTDYLRLVSLEYLLLFLAAVLLMGPTTDVRFLIVYALVFVVSMAIMLVRTLGKPDRDWYRSRAIAESIKTSTWRYAMCAHPFDGATPAARTKFTGFLTAILASSAQIGHRMAGLNAGGQQFTPEMESARNLSLEQRKAMYLSDRIQDQRSWYSGKAQFNRRRMYLWIGVCVAVYLLATLSVLSKLAYPNWQLPTEPLIVIASSIIGWMQIKKFSELSSAYTLTAHEIGIIESRAGEADTEDKFSDFVNEAELAFSREHTQWVARQEQG